MKKTKLVAIALVALVALMVPMVVSAASPSTGPVSAGNLPAGVTPVQTPASAEAKAQIAAAATANGVAGELALALDISLVDANGNPYQPGTAVPLRVYIAGVTAADKVTIVHVGANGTEVIGGNVGNGFVEFTVTAFSPFGFYVQKGAGAAGTTEPGTTTATSPKTGVYA